MLKKLLLFAAFSILPFQGEAASLPQIDAKDVRDKMQEIMTAHASNKEFTPEIARRTLANFLEELDPAKNYFLEPEIQQWLEPSEQLVSTIQRDYKQARFPLFNKIHALMLKAIDRRKSIDERVAMEEPPEEVNLDDLKDLPWAKSEDELIDRLAKVQFLQRKASENLDPEAREKAIQRIEKRQQKYEEKVREVNAEDRQKFIYASILKGLASALDTHTVYFTPGEAEQFVISVQQRLFGIGAQLQDDITGFKVVKIIEGGPAFRSKKLKVNDRIIAVDSEPIVGMDIHDAVDLIRGEEGVDVNLTVLRKKDEKSKEEEKLDLSITRGKVVIKENRFETSYEPYGDGVIGYIKLFSFYQDPQDSSSTDIHREITKLKSEHKVKGIVLDLRNNSGGVLNQAVAVTGLFITKGIVVSTKDSDGKVQHYRDFDNKVTWGGPLIVLVNRLSASAAEIVAQTLQDYKRAIVVGDKETYGKGTFQTFASEIGANGEPNPKGEFKVTRGRYYTVSGRSPQMYGVTSDIIVPSIFSEVEIGEQFAKYPLETDRITPSFFDDLSDIPIRHRPQISKFYNFNLQKPMKVYTQHLDTLRRNAKHRLENNKNYQVFLKELAKETVDEEEPENYGQNDLQLTEAYNIMRDLISLLRR